MDYLALAKQAGGRLRQYRYVLLVVLAGVLLMSLPTGEKDASEPKSQETPSQPPAGDLQEELEAILSRVEGAGRVEVLLTQSSGPKNVYQLDEELSSDSSRKKTVLVTDGSRAETGLLRQTLPPEYRGAVVICQGADSPRVVLRLVEAVAAATGLPSHKIAVLKMK